MVLGAFTLAPSSRQRAAPHVRRSFGAVVEPEASWTPVRPRYPLWDR